MDTLRLAVAGPGARAQVHLGTVGRMTDRYALVGVADSDPGRRDEVAGTHGVPGFGDVEEMLDVVRPDVLFVAVPPDGHHALTEAAARRGVHVLCETPVAPTLEMADAMLASAARHGVKLEVAEQMGTHPLTRMKRRIVEAGLIGEVQQVRLSYSSGGYHGMSMVRNVLRSAPRRALGTSRPVPPPTRVAQPAAPVWEHGLVEFDCGAVCVYEQAVHSQHRRRFQHLEVLGTEGFLAGGDLVFLQEGMKRWNPDRIPIEEVIEERDGRKVFTHLRVATDPEVVWENPHPRYGPASAAEAGLADLWVGMHRAVTEDAEPLYGGAAAREDQEIVIAVRESARLDSAWVDLPLTAKTGFERTVDDNYLARYGQSPLDALAGQAVRAFPHTGTVTIHGTHTG